MSVLTAVVCISIIHASFSGGKFCPLFGSQSNPSCDWLNKVGELISSDISFSTLFNDINHFIHSFCSWELISQFRANLWEDIFDACSHFDFVEGAISIFVKTCEALFNRILKRFLDHLTDLLCFLVVIWWVVFVPWAVFFGAVLHAGVFLVVAEVFSFSLHAGVFLVVAEVVSFSLIRLFALSSVFGNSLSLTDHVDLLLLKFSQFSTDPFCFCKCTLTVG